MTVSLFPLWKQKKERRLLLRRKYAEKNLNFSLLPVPRAEWGCLAPLGSSGPCWVPRASVLSNELPRLPLTGTAKRSFECIASWSKMQQCPWRIPGGGDEGMGQVIHSLHSGTLISKFRCSEQTPAHPAWRSHALSEPKPWLKSSEAAASSESIK